ncbi:murein transglycosylase A [Pelagibius marinus]|uniref:murein transglycosylase A n=1 Tax=Pelagibius marinus TaxID=2762760 RepID=UPI001872CA06|nr:MltA domain-containing protein [Pelagibius marinus]
MKAAPLAGALLLAGLLLAACGGEEPAPPKEPPEPPKAEAELPPAEPALLLEPVDFAALPGWEEDDLAAALPALTRSCGRLLAQPDDRAVGPDALAGSVADWRVPCDALGQITAGDDAALRAALEQHFRPFAVSNAGAREGLFTGYYEAELKAAAGPDAPGATPLYRVPDDLVTVDLALFRADLRGEKLVGRVQDGRLVPYLTRKEIDAGALADRGLELVWAGDPVDAFFLHVQGSGRVVFPDGRVTRVGFAGSNGHPFYAIGRALIDEGVIDRKSASMQKIRDWLRAHPQKAEEVMQRNARYIFFREITGEGPIGAQGVALTPGRSLAVDSALLPLGVPLWLDTTWPATDRPLRRLMVAQDVGSAIKGAVRGDFFWGSGDEALAEAGRMKQKGSYYLFLPKAVAERRETAS